MNLELLNTKTYITYFILSLVTVLLIVVCVAFFTLLERKILGGIQRRRGPNFVGFWGLLQAFSDALKLLLKEISVPSGAHFFLFMFSAITILTLSLTLWSIVPFISESSHVGLNYSLFFIFIISTLNVYNLILAGMSSNSRYALIGGVRSAAQMISYEIPLSLSLIGIGLLAGSFNLNNIISTQMKFINLFLALPFFLVFVVCALAETNRTPFDLPEAEAEIVAGYNVEYSSILFAFFFLAEYSNIMFISFFMVGLFFGIKMHFFFFIKVLLVMLFFILVRGVLPRYRYSQLMEICWKFMFPAILGYLYFIAVVFFIFKLSPSVGYDRSILSLIDSLLNYQYSNVSKLKAPEFNWYLCSDDFQNWFRSHTEWWYNGKSNLRFLGSANVDVEPIKLSVCENQVCEGGGQVCLEGSILVSCLSNYNMDKAGLQLKLEGLNFNVCSIRRQFLLYHDINKGISLKMRLENPSFNYYLETLRKEYLFNVDSNSFNVASDLMLEYKKLFIFFLASLVFSLLLVTLTWILIPKNRNNAKNSSYECGYEPIGAPTAKFEVHFYIVAILFIIFDVEILFLYPWVVGLGRLPAHALFTMSVFLGVLLIGYAYEWLKGALDWENEKK